MRILLVEDTADLRTFLADALEHEGYAVVPVPDGATALGLLDVDDIDIVLLDLILPDLDGLEVLRRIRQRHTDLPVVIMSARGEIADRVTGLDRGADDYITKPFALEELIARIRSRLRRPDQASAHRLTGTTIAIDLRAREVVRDGVPVLLTAREYQLLVELLQHEGQVLTRQRLLQSVWNLDFDPGSKVVEVYMGYLRRKLHRPGLPDPIETVRQAGYRLKDR